MLEPVLFLSGTFLVDVVTQGDESYELDDVTNNVSVLFLSGAILVDVVT